MTSILIAAALMVQVAAHFPTQEEVAQVQAATEVVKACAMREVASVDDGISPAPLIAKILASRCSTEVWLLITISHAFLTDDQLMEFSSGYFKGDAVPILDIVLSYRASHR